MALSIGDRLERYRSVGRRAAEYLLAHQRPNGAFTGDDFPEDVYHKNAYFLAVAGYVAEAHKLLDWVREHNLTDTGELRHYYSPGRMQVYKDACLTIAFDAGATAQVYTSQRLSGRYGWLDVMGREGRVRAEWESSTVCIQSRKCKAYRHLTRIDVPWGYAVPPVPPIARASLSSHRCIRAWLAEIAEFVIAIRECRDPAVTGEDGVRVLEITDAAFRSAAVGGRVALPS